MIEPIVTAMQPLVTAELRRAQAEHGAEFCSPHEGYGVICEEVQEAQEDLNNIRIMMDVMLNLIRYGADVQQIADKIERSALEGAAECIQVAAMCRKMIGDCEAC